MTCTLLGEVKQFAVVHNGPANESGPGSEVNEEWSSRTQKVAKVNAMSITGDRMAIGGLTGEGKGVVEVWDVSKDAIGRMVASRAGIVSQGDSAQ